MTSPPALPAAPIVIDAEPPEPSLRNTMLAAAVAIGVGFGGFLGWGFLADLDSAVIAQGTVMVDSHRKTVSHLEGGILKTLMVREGEDVAAGQVLLRLDDTQAQALVGQLRGQLWAAGARVARLRAEQARAREFALPPDLLEAAATDPVAAEVVNAERSLFAARWETYDGTLAVQGRRIAQLREQVKALRAQSVATADRLAYTEEELKAVQELLEKGYERKPRMLELRRLTAELRGTMGELKAKEAEAQQAIAAAELEVLNLENTRQTEVSDDLQRSQTLAADLTERLRGASDVLARQTVVAPQAGRVNALQFFTPGGVIPAGAPILDIVPQNDELVVEARVAPFDIESVHAGRSARVRLSAYKQRDIPLVAGQVVSVSPDLLRDERTGLGYYTARVRLSAEELARLSSVSLYPGMPTEVLIEGRARKAIDYFLAPITDSMRRAFREE